MSDTEPQGIAFLCDRFFGYIFLFIWQQPVASDISSMAFSSITLKRIILKATVTMLHVLCHTVTAAQIALSNLVFFLYVVHYEKVLLGIKALNIHRAAWVKLSRYFEQKVLQFPSRAKYVTEKVELETRRKMYRRWELSCVAQKVGVMNSDIVFRYEMALKTMVRTLHY